ncbi:filamentous hemagglutinin N-terminal domain-containing protein [Gloeocapsopsis crepidinum LEGE 06123]|uniref:Filamentous hemagglutinin N-terminal domain-containing protein n=1 Tax=Gloeocapsopsis crepidinum LEGE 06123 TaxID=588587 RepID=A0ABR9US05_9CHRO|nr:filamentous hemagglutinin N-terminal domain-containing protein [Gloeocapsopsis crepidinum]MBE9191077.1 filamentous hemagglutinin N-terminal domain-containing protein [Gloeocapsopsis crepidinum LEGE 06123]
MTIYSRIIFYSQLIRNLLVLGIIGKILCVLPAIAQIVPDETLESEKSVVTSFDPVPIDFVTGGATRGINLFHSFQEFNVNAGRQAYFSNPAGIENILSRVTGKNPSSILGLLGVLGNANLFLINPNGIIFGSEAILDVQGSFVTTTANAVQFGNQGFFNTANPTSISLLSVNPSAFLFNQIAPNSFIYQSTSFLQVPGSNSLIFLGGNVTIDGGRLFAPSGRVEIGGLAGEGKVELTINGGNLDLNFPRDVARADVLLTNAAGIGVAGEGGGSIEINARDINLLGASFLSAGIQPNLGSIDTQAGDITLDASGQVTLGEFSLVGNFVTPNSTGSGGNIYIKTESLSITEGAQIGAATVGQGDGGNIKIDARDTVTVAGFNNGERSGILSTVNIGANGNAGSISIETENLFLNDGAQVVANTFGEGNAGSIFVQADNVSLDNASGILSSVSSGAVGDGGDINIQTRSLSLTNGSQVQAAVFREQGEIPGGQGKGGNISINASESVDLVGISSVQLPITSPFNPLKLLPTEGFSSGLFTSTEKGAIGSGGNITINTRSLQVRNGAIVNAQTLNSSDGGNITLNVNTFTATGGGQVLTVSRDRGKAGNITLTATDSITLSGNDPSFSERFERFGRDVVNNEGSASGLFASTDADSTGSGGTINLGTRNLFLSDRAEISAQSLGTGIAGNISIRADESVEANNSDIATSASQSIGGAINIVAGDIRLHGDSDIRTNVASGEGGGGNIALSANSVLAFDVSDILAFARDGQGGNIILNTPVFFAENFQPAAFNTNPDNLEGNNRADVNASGAVAGVVTVPDVSFIQNSLTDLPENPINTDTLIANSCIARSPQQGGNFLVTGAGGLPLRPGDSVSTYPTGTVRSIPNNTSSRPWQLGDPIVEPQGVYRLANGRLLLSRECL